MLHFETPDRRRPRNYLARREQYRLLALVAALGAVVLLIQQFAGEPSPSAPGSAGGPTQVENQISPPAEPGSNAVDRERLANIRDNSHFRHEETDAWFYLLALAKEQGRALNSATAADVTYTQLVAQPQTYRGQLVHLQGEVKRIEAITPAENDLDIETLYRVLMKPPGRSPWPITVYCLELPPDWTPGEPPSNQVEVTGFFFKNHSYAWQNGMALSPIIVAHSFSVHEVRTPAATAATSSASAWTIVASAAAIAVASVAFVLWRTATLPPARKDDATHVGTALHRLAQEEK